MSRTVLRGEVWEVDFDPVAGHDQGGRRPALVISSNRLHAIPSELATIIPITTRDRDIRAHVRIIPPEGGVSEPSVILTEQIRTVRHQRLLRRRGTVSEETLSKIKPRLRYFLEL